MDNRIDGGKERNRATKGEGAMERALKRKESFCEGGWQRKRGWIVLEKKKEENTNRG